MNCIGYSFTGNEKAWYTNVKSIHYESFNESHKSYKLQYEDKTPPRTNEDFKSLILDYELSAWSIYIRTFLILF